MIIPADGYHHPLSTLRTFPNPDDAIYRRGAPDTFDVPSLLRDVRRILLGDEDVVRVPGFDHSIGDPEPGAHAFVRDRHDLVLVEGLYLLHDGDGWGSDLYELFDLRIFLNCDVDVCVDRLRVRNKCLPGYTAEEIDVRCEEVDRVNAVVVAGCGHRADVVVESAVASGCGGGNVNT